MSSANMNTPEEAHIFKIDCTTGQVNMNWLGPNSEDHPIGFCGYHYTYDEQGDIVSFSSYR